MKVYSVPDSNEMIKFTLTKYPIILIFSLMFMVAVSEIQAGPTQIFRVTPDFAEWTKERDEIVECYHKNLKPPVEAKVVPLFVTVNIVIGDPISVAGAQIWETAFIYSEVPLENGAKEQKIVIFTRSPYENRRWKWEPSVVIEEGGEPWYSYYVIDKSIDLQKQISAYAKKVTKPLFSRDHTIAMIVFEDSITAMLGKKLDDEMLLALIFQPKTEPEKPEEKK